jgi:hypothetical protein
MPEQLAPRTTPKRPIAKDEFSHDVEKLVSELRGCAMEMEAINTLIVKDALNKIVKKTPKQRHTSAVDHFAALPAIAEEPGSVSEGGLQVRFRVRISSRGTWHQKTY